MILYLLYVIIKNDAMNKQVSHRGTYELAGDQDLRPNNAQARLSG
ncbi:MAG: hypothetical protein JWQ38_3687 [Flavipsychrobacter sp.]|nr:hypothetical protein [Flavipsychrobacter sp.]